MSREASFPIVEQADSGKTAAPFWGRGLWNIKLWVTAALLFSLLATVTGQDFKSPLGFLDPLLMIGFLAGIQLNKRFRLRGHWEWSGRQAAVFYVACSWLIGMLIELSIQESPGNFGGLHPKTLPSFILAQGYYLPLALLSLWLVRRYHYTFWELFFVGSLISLYEALQFGVPGVLFSPLFFLTPLVFAYYTVVYAQLLNWGLLFVDERQLWHRSAVAIPRWRKWLYGFLLGLVCWAIFALWGSLMNLIFAGFVSF